MSEVRSDIGSAAPARAWAMPALAGPYQPFILTGHRSGQAPRIEPELGCYRLWFVREGAHEIATRVGRFTVAAGAGLLMQPGGRVGIRARGRSSWLRIDFDVWHRPRRRGHRDAVEPCPGAGDQPSPRAVWGQELAWEIPAELRDECRAAMERMADLWWRGPFERLEANALLAGLLVRLLRRPRASETVARPAVDRAEAWARERLGERPTVAAMASAVGLHRAYFAELYRAHRGRTPHAFLDDLRMERARELLAQPRHAIAAVAAMAGYSSAVAFGRRFRRRYGLSPSAWRSRGPGR